MSLLRFLHIPLMICLKLKTIIYVPALLIFLISNDNRIVSDFNSFIKNNEIHTRNRALGFIKLFSRFKEYRNVFYYRIGFDHRLISWLAPGVDSLNIITQNIGNGFYVCHGTSSQINAVEIGDNFQSWHNVTIGVKNQFDNQSRPRIGNNVKILTGAVVCGDISIGNNVIIGANSVVIKSIPDNCLAVGNPARIIHRDNME